MPAVVSLSPDQEWVNCWTVRLQGLSNAAPVPMECGVVDYRFESRYHIAKSQEVQFRTELLVTIGSERV